MFKLSGYARSCAIRCAASKLQSAFTVKPARLVYILCPWNWPFLCLFQLSLQVTPPRQGYEYAGRVQFVSQQTNSVPFLQLGSQQNMNEAADRRAEVLHHTVLVTRSGHAYMKR